MIKREFERWTWECFSDDCLRKLTPLILFFALFPYTKQIFLNCLCWHMKYLFTWLNKIHKTKMKLSLFICHNLIIEHNTIRSVAKFCLIFIPIPYIIKKDKKNYTLSPIFLKVTKHHHYICSSFHQVKLHDVCPRKLFLFRHQKVSKSHVSIQIIPQNSPICHHHHSTLSSGHNNVEVFHTIAPLITSH
jgi:hypothetical protein